MTVAAGRLFPVPLLRWFMVVGALFAVTLFGGASGGDTSLTPVSMAGHAVCPNVVLQASLPGALAAEAGGRAPDDGHGPGEIAGACLFVVVALAGLALAGEVRRPLLAYGSSWWTRLFPSRFRSSALAPMWVGVLRI